MVKTILIAGIKLYQKTVRCFGIRSCRFYPSCSDYAIEAIEKKGPFKGTGMAIWRVLRCNPFNHGGFDPVEHVNNIKR